MSIRDLPEKLQSYILEWCLEDKSCPLDSVCNELVTKNCAIVRFLNDLNEEKHQTETGKTMWIRH